MCVHVCPGARAGGCTRGGGKTAGQVLPKKGNAMELGMDPESGPLDPEMEEGGFQSFSLLLYLARCMGIPTTYCIVPSIVNNHAMAF